MAKLYSIPQLLDVASRIRKTFEEGAQHMVELEQNANGELIPIIHLQENSNAALMEAQNTIDDEMQGLASLHNRNSPNENIEIIKAKTRQRCGADSNLILQNFQNQRKRTVSNTTLNSRGFNSDDCTSLCSEGSASRANPKQTTKINTIELKVNVLEFETSRLKDNLSELKNSDDIGQIRLRIDKFEKHVQDQLKKTQDTTVVKNDHLKMLIAEYEKVCEESINFKKEIKRLMTEVRRDVAIQKELSEKLISPQQLVTEQFEYDQGKFDNIQKNYLSSFERIGALESQQQVIMERLDPTTIKEQPTIEKFEDSAVKFHREFNTLKENSESCRDEVKKLLADQQTITRSLDEMSQRLDRLSASKSDKHDVKELLAEKVDYSMVQDKVSLDLFHTNCRNLEKRIKDAAALHNELTNCLTIKIEELQRTIDDKINRHYFVAVTALLEQKIQILSDKIKRMPRNDKLEPKEAATRKDYLQNVNWLSCEKNVALRTEKRNNNLPKAKLMHVLKKKHMTTLEGRNMFHFEVMSKTHDEWMKNNGVIKSTSLESGPLEPPSDVKETED